MQIRRYSMAAGLTRRLSPSPSSLCTRHCSIVGEALAQVPADVRGLAPDIPWKLFKDLRNRIVHGYWQIDLELLPLCSTVTLTL
jgi:uncharacterized protein with HEPN domain